MSDQPNAFTAGPALTWASSNPKRPDLAPRKSGIILGERTSPGVSAANVALNASRRDVLDRYTRRAGRK